MKKQHRPDCVYPEYPDVAVYRDKNGIAYLCVAVKTIAGRRVLTCVINNGETVDLVTVTQEMYYELDFAFVSNIDLKVAAERLLHPLNSAVVQPGARQHLIRVCEELK